MHRILTSALKRLRESPSVLAAVVSSFRSLQAAGVNVTPNHYYWPVPDLTKLDERKWPSYSPPAGCDLNLYAQLALAQEWSARYGDEMRFGWEPTSVEYHHGNGYFESFDSEIAYCMVRHWKPKRIIEIGSGYSTRIMASALDRNEEEDGVSGELVAIDPAPDRLPRNTSRIRVRRQSINDIDLELFTTLKSNDFLFIDSSHVVSIGSDVIREYLEIMPALNPGVLVHVHDIFLPSDYPREAVLNRLCFWSEQYLLQAFLSFNTAFEVLWSSSAMQMRFTEPLERCFPAWSHSYQRMPHTAAGRFVPTLDSDHVWPTSFWMRRLQS